MKIELEMNNLSEKEREQLMKLVEKANKPKPGRWKPNCGEEYYYILSNGEVRFCHWNDYSTDKDKFAIGNIFKTEEEVKFALEKRKVEVELQYIADKLNDGWVPDWNDVEEGKYYIFYNFVFKQLEVLFEVTHKISTVYFKSKYEAERAITTIGEERLKTYYFEV